MTRASKPAPFTTTSSTTCVTGTTDRFSDRVDAVDWRSTLGCRRLRGTGGPSSAARPHGPTRFRSGWTCATPPVRPGRRRFLLTYGQGDWNALHRHLFGEPVFPLQVVINLNHPGVDHTGREFLLDEQRPRAQSRATATLIPHGHGLVFTTRDRPVCSVRGRTATRVAPPSAPGQAKYQLLGGDQRPYRSATPGRFGGNRRGKLYGRLDCATAARAIAAGGYVTHRVFFADEGTAVAAGYRPCAVCLPDAYRK